MTPPPMMLSPALLVSAPPAEADRGEGASKTTIQPVPPPGLPPGRDGWWARRRAAYNRATPVGKTFYELGLAYAGYMVTLPLILLAPQLAMSEDNAAGIGSVFQDALQGSNLYLALAGVALLLAVAVPVTEELIFRGIPLLVRLGLRRILPTRTHRALGLVIGLVSAVVFARVHNLVPGTLPLPQLWLGLLAWHAASTRGLRYSMLLHGLNNAVVLLLVGPMLLMGPVALPGGGDGASPSPAVPSSSAAQTVSAPAH